MILVAVTLFAGIFFGTSIVLAYVVWIKDCDVKNLTAERKLLTNKIFVREGSTPLFSQENITGKEAPKPGAPIRAPSPFFTGLKNAREKQDAIPAKPLPPEIQEQIKADFERRTNGAA